MCLGGGGGYTPPPMKQAAAPEPGPASPNDMVNNQQIPNANDRSSMEGNRNAMDPKKDELKVAQPSNSGQKARQMRRDGLQLGRDVSGGINL